MAPRNPSKPADTAAAQPGTTSDPKVNAASVTPGSTPTGDILIQPEGSQSAPEVRTEDAPTGVGADSILNNPSVATTGVPPKPTVRTLAPTAPAAPAPAPAPEGTKQKWLDGVYTFNGVQYGPSRFPGDLITVPESFPDDKGGKEPSREEWKPAAESVVKETNEESTTL